MTKLFKYFVEFFLISFCKGSNPYETVSCNNDQNVSLNKFVGHEVMVEHRCSHRPLDPARVKIHLIFFQGPELTFRIEKDHFELNFQGQEADYELEGDYYKRVVVEADLDVGFDDENDGKIFN